MSAKRSSDEDPDPQTQALWLRQIAANGREANAALKALIRAYRNRKFLPFLNNKRFENGERDDLLQDIWLAIVRSAKNFKAGADPSPWLWAIARHKTIDALDARKNERQLLSLDEEHVSLAFDLQHADAQKAPPPTRAELCQEWAFAQLMASHPEAADLLRLSMAEKWTLEKLAEHRGTNVHATAQFLSQARIRLRDYNKQCLSGKAG